MPWCASGRHAGCCGGVGAALEEHAHQGDVPQVMTPCYARVFGRARWSFGKEKGWDGASGRVTTRLGLRVILGGVGIIRSAMRGM